MAITVNGSKTLIQDFFGYNPDLGASNPAAQLASATGISGTTVTLASATSWAVNSQVVVTVSSVTYVGVAVASQTGATSLVVDAWYNQSTWAITTPSFSGAYTVAIIPQTLGGTFLGLSGTSNTNYGQVTESSFGELSVNGLGRKKATTVTYTPGTAPSGAANATGTLTLSATWTYTGSTSQPCYGLGVYIAPYVASRSNNTMLFATAITSAPTVTTNGDQLVVTETISQS